MIRILMLDLGDTLVHGDAPLPHVPEAFRESFLQRNPTNRSLLAAADRRLTH